MLSTLRICVTKTFRYTAPLVQWAPEELREHDSLRKKGFSHAYRLGDSFPKAPIMLDTAHGGIASVTSLKHLLKELKIHTNQCSQHEDELAALRRDSARQEMHASGHTSFAEAFHPNRHPRWRLNGSNSKHAGNMEVAGKDEPRWYTADPRDRTVAEVPIIFRGNPLQGNRQPTDDGTPVPTRRSGGETQPHAAYPRG